MVKLATPARSRAGAGRAVKRAYGLILALAACAAAPLAAHAEDEVARWRREAARVEIVRDDWGIAHVHGRTDADAVFGAIYAEAEDDFPRIEANYLTALGRTAEADGASAVWADLRQRLYVDPENLRARYAASPAWLRALMDAWADGLNLYLARHPETHPRVITRFEPWMALSFSEGSIGGDIERISLKDLAAFYGGPNAPPAPESEGERFRAREAHEGGAPFKEPGGSNGVAIAPKDSASGHALLLINPHTSFFFRSELQMSSDEGLNAYGAATWGQFFLYQGFNPHIGWMHTSSGVDAVDEFAETIVNRGGRLFYRYGAEERPVSVSTVRVPYRAASGALAERRFTIYRTHHGPIVRAADGKWVAFAMMDKPVEALSQSWLRTKASDYASFLKIAENYRANSSNNTVLADDKGEIAYLHPQFIPARDDRFDYTRPVDGSDPRTDWHGLTPFARTPHLLNPSTGWLFNTNDWPYSAAGPDSPRRADFPRYMDMVGENPRGVHATRLLSERHGFTLRSLNAAAFDPWLPAFDTLIPHLVAAYDATPATDPLKARLREQVAALKGWDRRWGLQSTQTSLAVFWGEALWARRAAAAKAQVVPVYQAMAQAPAADMLQALADASDRLTADFGSWRTPWGEINRFQRLTDDITPSFDDTKPSTPTPFTSSQWGSLASFGARRYPGTKRYYGTSGNSFVAVVEFGPTVHAVAVTAGGESGHPGSPHFADEVGRYVSGNLRELYFYPAQLTGHTERRYHPGA